MNKIEKIKKPKIFIFLNDPECSVICCAGMYEALSENYNIQIFTKHDLSVKLLKKADIIAFPGGIGNSGSFEELLEDKVDIVKEYLAKGGRYLGICMGAYWAGHYYFDILDGIKVVQYIKRRDTEIKRSYATIAEVNWNNHKENMYFYDGCAFICKPHKQKTIATYANGDPMAIMQNRIGLIGCHPESSLSWYRQLYLKQYWHEFRHHELLLNFVNDLMER
jgi:glutamine amidotransferase-like uncharacterized protein